MTHKLEYKLFIPLVIIFLSHSVFAQGWHNLNCEEISVARPRTKLVAEGIGTVPFSLLNSDESLNNSKNDAIFSKHLEFIDGKEALNDLEVVVRTLNGDEKSILKYVMTEIKIDYYFGIRRSAKMVLQDKKGNDYEKCLLAYKLLVIAGKAEDYYLMRAWVKMPVSETTDRKYSVENLLGAKGLDPIKAASYLRRLGVNALGAELDFDGNEIPYNGYVYINRIILVKRNIEGNDEYFDPYMLKKSFSPGRGISLDSSIFTDIQSGDIAGNYVQNVQSTPLIAALKNTAKVLNFGEDENINSIIGSIDYEYFNEAENIEFISFSEIYNYIYVPDNTLGYKYDGNGENYRSIIGLYFREPLNEDYARMTFYYGRSSVEDANLTQVPKNFTLSELNCDKVWFSFEGGNFVIRKGEDEVFRWKITSGNVKIKTCVTYPLDPMLGWNTSVNMCDVITNSSETVYLVAYVPDPSTRVLASARDALLKENKSNSIASLPDSRLITSNCLNIMALEWMRQTNMVSKMLGKINSCDSFIVHRLGRTVQQHNGAGVSFFIDVPVNNFTVVSLGESEKEEIKRNKENDAFKAASIYASAFEHSIIEQMQSGMTAISTVKAFSYANKYYKSSTKPSLYMAVYPNERDAVPIFGIDFKNRDNIENMLIFGGANNYTITGEYSDLNSFRSLWEKNGLHGETSLEEDGVLIIPQEKDVTPRMWYYDKDCVQVYHRPNCSHPLYDNWKWKGGGYMYISDSKVAMIISGGYNGGYSSIYKPISPSLIQSQYLYSPDYTSGNKAVNQSTSIRNISTLVMPKTIVADPVDLASGAYFYESEDISVGGHLKFIRYYNSNSAENPSALGYGWTHNYSMSINKYTDAESILSAINLSESSTFLTYLYAVNALLKNYRANLNEMTNGEKAKLFYLVCDITKNAVSIADNNRISVNIGSECLVFRNEISKTITEEASTAFPKGRKMSQYFEALGSNYKLYDYTYDGINYKELALPYSDTITFQYIANKWLPIAIENPVKGKITLTYASSDGELTEKLLRVGDDNTNSIGFNYSGKYIKSVYNEAAAANPVTFTYNDIGLDASGEKTCVLAAVNDVLGKTWKYTYIDRSKLVEMENPKGELIIKNFYNSSGTIWKQYLEGDENKEWLFLYTGKQNQEIDPYGNKNKYFYNEMGLCVAYENALNQRTEYVYDKNLRRINTIKPNGDEYRIEYDKWNNIISEDLYEYKGSSLIWRSGVFNVYESAEQAGNDNPRLISSTKRDAENSVSGRIKTINGYYQNGTKKTDLPLSVTDEKGVVSAFTYDTVYPRLKEQNVGGFITKYESFISAKSDLPKKITYPDGIIETLVYNANGDIITSTKNGLTTAYTYDTKRRLTTSRVTGSGITATETSLNYESGGNILSATDSEGKVKSYTWSPVGKKLSETTIGGELSQTTTYEYDLADRLVKTTLPGGQEIHFTLDAAGQVVAETSAERTVQYEYDANGRKTKVIAPDGTVTEYSYDALGNKISEKDARGNIVRYEYNPYGEQVRLVNRKGGKFKFNTDYDARKSTMESAMGNTVTTSYTPDTWLLSSIESNSGKIANFTYDARWRKTKTIDNYGTLTYGYDSYNRLSTINEGSKTLTYTYDLLDNIRSTKSLDLGVSNTVTYTYTPANRIKTIAYPKIGNMPAKTVTYGYDSLGRLSSVTEGQRVISYQYDSAGRLCKVIRPNGTYRNLIYDQLTGDLKGIEEIAPDNDPIMVQAFHYDSSGRINRRLRAPQPAAVERNEMQASYDLDNKFSSVSLNSSTYPVEYDLDGNMTRGPITKDKGAVFVYDGRNRLASTMTDSGEVVAYTYGADNNRLTVQSTEKVLNDEGMVTGTLNVTDSYLYNRSVELSQALIRRRQVHNEKNVLQRTDYYSYIYGAGLEYEVEYNSAGKEVAVRYYHYDHLGSNVAMTDSSGSVVSRYSYDVFGNHTTEKEGSYTPFLFVGAYGIQTDPNGLINMRARYYSPTTLSFISADPSGFNGGLNWYMYANGNPMGFVDPDGEFAVAAAVPFLMGGATSVIMGASIATITNTNYTYQDAAIDFMAGMVVVGVINKARQFYRIHQIKQAAKAKGMTLVQRTDYKDVWKGGDNVYNKLEIKYSSAKPTAGELSQQSRFKFRINQGKYYDPITQSIGNTPYLKHIPLRPSPLSDSVVSTIGMGSGTASSFGRYYYQNYFIDNNGCKK